LLACLSACPLVSPRSNSYFSFFYIAFVKRTAEKSELMKCDNTGFVLTNTEEVGTCNELSQGCYKGCGTRFNPMGCMDELSTQIMMIFVTQLVVGNTMELVVPLLKQQWEIFWEKRATAQSRGSNAALEYEQPELESKYATYRVEKEAFDDCESLRARSLLLSSARPS
jgi:hypothetical protein